MTRTEIRTALVATIAMTLAVSACLPAAFAAMRGVGGLPGVALAKPALTLAAIAPAFLLGGRLQPRHPLVCGFVAGASAVVLLDGRLGLPSLGPFALSGEAVATALTCSVAAFAGRQFMRLRAEPVATSPP